VSETANKACVTWKEKGLSYSYLSYRLAWVQDAQQVAWETGHDPHTVFAHFNDLVTRDEASSWFNIVPVPTASPFALSN
jgi:hypothetical protein